MKLHIFNDRALPHKFNIDFPIAHLHYCIQLHMYTQVLKEDDIVYVDDGLISLKVTEKTKTTLTTSKFVS